MYINWIPLNKAICLQDYEESQDKALGAAQYVKERLDVMDEYMKELFEACRMMKKK